MTSKTQTRTNVDPRGGTTGPGPGSGSSTLEGAGGHVSGSCVTAGMALHALSAGPGDKGQAQE